MERGLFRFIWKHSRRAQLGVLALTLASFPFLYLGLEIPKQIVNRALADTGEPRLILGTTVGPATYLVLLCLAFLALVVVNGAFKMRINTLKGLMAERMLRRLRHEMCFRILRFPNAQFERVSSGELVSAVTAEVEPLGGFIGDAIVQPVFQGGTLLTILLFLFVQDPVLGLASIALIPVQAWLVPRLQRRVKQLGKERVKRVRRLAEGIGETVAGARDIRVNGTGAFALAGLSARLGEILEVRLLIYRRKFAVKFVVNLLNQLTVFLFFLVGGLLVLNGSLTLGALVAGLAAYKDISTPWKELLDHYQQRQDATQKYDQLAEQFAPPGLADGARLLPAPDTFPPLTGGLEATGLALIDPDGVGSVVNATFAVPPGSTVAITGADPVALDRLAHLVVRVATPTGGRLASGGTDLSRLHDGVFGARVGYVGAESQLFSGTVADNIAFGLRQARPRPDPADAAALAFAVEAERSGSPVETADGDWRAFEAAGLDGPAGYDAWTRRVLDAVDVNRGFQRQGLRAVLDPASVPGLADAALDLRRRLPAVMEAASLGDLVARYDPDAFNPYATVTENVLFGVAEGDDLADRTALSHPAVRAAADAMGLTRDLLRAGVRTAAILAEIGDDLAADHPLRDAFGLTDPTAIADLRALVARTGADPADTSAIADRDAAILLGLVGATVTERHRLGVVDGALQVRLLDLRRGLRARTDGSLADRIVPFDAEAYNPRMPVLANILFGRVAETRPGAGTRIETAVLAALDETDLPAVLTRTVLGQAAGVGGSRLAPSTRTLVALCRAMVKRPAILVVNQCFAALPAADRRTLRDRLRALAPDMALVWFDRAVDADEGFDTVYELVDGRIAASAGGPSAPVAAAPDATTSLGREVAMLRGVPLFAELPPARLKLIALSSRRVRFADREILFRRGEAGDSAYLLMEGEVAIVPDAERPDPADAVVRMGRHALLGDIALISNRGRSMSAVAVGEVVALRIDRDVILDVIEQDGRVAMAILRVMVDRLLAAESRPLAPR
jgi:putative ABC transport system ATP-binding protein